MSNDRETVFTYGHAATPPSYARWLIQPTGLWTAGMTIFLCALFLWQARVPKDWFSHQFDVVLMLALAVGWIFRLVLRVVLTQVYARSFAPLPSKPWPALGVTVAIILTAGFIGLRLPENIAFELSKRALAREAEAMIVAYRTASAPPTERVRLPGRRIGAYSIREIWYDPRHPAVTFFFADFNAPGPDGWTYSPEPGLLGDSYGPNDAVRHAPLGGHFYATTKEY
jgi:hypothetical protein